MTPTIEDVLVEETGIEAYRTNELIKKAMRKWASLNRQGCRWVKAGDGIPQEPEMKQWRYTETKEPTLWPAIRKIAVSENHSDEVEWLSIEPRTKP